MIRLIAPKRIRRPVRFAIHFHRKSKEELRQLSSPKIREIMLARWPERPYGHDLLQLKCGHSVIRIRQSAGPILWRPQVCEMCTRRDREMNVRYIRSDLKKKRRAKKMAVRRTQVLRLKLRRQK